MFLSPHTQRKRGFTLIELALVLGIVAVMSAGLWRLMSTGSQQTKDQATAQQHLMLINAIQGYLADTSPTGGQALMQRMDGLSTANLPLDCTKTSLMIGGASTGATIDVGNLCGTYLPAGFTVGTTNPYGQSYKVQILKDGILAGTRPTTYSFMIVASGGPAPIPDTDGGRIAGLIGGDGGFLYTSGNVCGGPAPQACGALGAWKIADIKASYGFSAATATAGSVASRTYVSSATSGGGSNQWLARVLLDPSGSTTPTYNTMTTPLLMGGKTLYLGSDMSLDTGGTGGIKAQGGTIDLGGNGSITATPTAGTHSSPINIVSDDGGSLNYVGPDLVHLATGCQALVLPDPNCSAALSIVGDEIITGALWTTGLYSQAFTYHGSDARLKKDIQPLRNSLADVMQLKPVSFAYKANSKKSMGVIAQDLEKVYPQLVAPVFDGMNAVRYDGLIAPLIGALQELKRENDSLREELHRQKEQQDKNEQAIEKLRQD